MSKATSKITIQRPIEQVFDYVSHMENDPLWCPEVKSVEQESEGEPGIGTTYKIVVAFSSDELQGGYEITAYEHPTRLEWKLWQGGIRANNTYRLEAVEGGTRLIYTINGSLPENRKFLDPVVGFLNRVFYGPRALRRLKRVLESD
jgi:uncharacterized membrane protein